MKPFVRTFLLLWCSTLAAWSQGSAFTYQGRLNGTNGPATGIYDFRFALYDTATAGVQQGGPLTNSATGVTDGLFVVTLDFGAAVFNGAARWLEIGVRTNGVGTFTTLAPRQALTPTPYAIFADDAATSEQTLRIANNAMADGNILMAATATIGGLQANGNSGVLTIQAPGNVFSSGGGSPGGILRLKAGHANISCIGPPPAGTSYGNDVEIIAGENTFGGICGNVYNGNIRFLAGEGQPERMRIVGDNGNVGIGTTNPLARLDVAGNFNLSGSINMENKQIINAKNAQGNLESVFWPRWDDNVMYLNMGSNGFNFRDASSVTKMFITSAGNIGIPTMTPTRMIDLGGLNREGMMRFTSSSTNGAGRSWDIGVPLSDGSTSGKFFSFVIDDPSTGTAPEMTIRWLSGFVGIGTTNPATRLDVAGEVTCIAVNVTSDRNAKQDFINVNPRDVLEKVSRLPISEWQYKEQTDARHIGPMAQDFHEAFGLGRDDKHIASVDADGVALAAIQGLNQKLDEQAREKDARIRALEQTVAELKALVGRLAEDRASR